MLHTTALACSPWAPGGGGGGVKSRRSHPSYKQKTHHVGGLFFPDGWPFLNVGDLFSPYG